MNSSLVGVLHGDSTGFDSRYFLLDQILNPCKDVGLRNVIWTLDIGLACTDKGLKGQV